MRDLNLGPSRIAVFEDCKASALTTKPPQLDFSCYFLLWQQNRFKNYLAYDNLRSTQVLSKSSQNTSFFIKLFQPPIDKAESKKNCSLKSRKFAFLLEQST